MTRIETRTIHGPGAVRVGRAPSVRGASSRGAPSGERVAGHRLVPPPDRDRATVATAFARFVADIIDEPTPTVRWFAPSADAPLAFVHHDHADTVFLRDNLTADEMLIAIPHELAHLHQFRRWPELTEAEAEAAAERFAEQILAEAPTAEAPTAEAPTAEAATRHRQFLPTASTTSERAWTGTRAWPRWSPDG